MRHKIAQIGLWCCVMAVSMFCVSTSAKAYVSNEPWKVIRADDSIFPDTIIQQGDNPLFVGLHSDTSGADGSHDTYLNCTSIWEFSDPVYNWKVGSDWTVAYNVPKGTDFDSYKNLALYFFDKTKMPYYSKAESRWYNTTIDDMYPGSTVADIDSYNTRLKELMSLETYGNSGIIVPQSYLVNYSAWLPMELAEDSYTQDNLTTGLTWSFNAAMHNANTIIEDTPVSNWFAETEINNLICVIGPKPIDSDELADVGQEYTCRVCIWLGFNTTTNPHKYNVGDYYPYVRPMDVSIVSPPVDATKQQELNDWVTNSGNMSQWDTDLGFELVPFVTSMLQPWMIKLMLVIFGFGVLMIFIRRSLHD